MKFKRNPKTDWDLVKLSDEELSLIPLIELQRIVNKRKDYGLNELYERALEELNRRNPRNNWKCTRCENTLFHEKEIRVSGGFLESFLGWERNKYHVLVCNYCGKSEFYNVQMSAGEQGLGFFGR